MDDGFAERDIGGLFYALGLRLLAPIEPGTASLALRFLDAYGWMLLATDGGPLHVRRELYVRRKLTGPSSAPARRLRLTVMTSGGSDMPRESREERAATKYVRSDTMRSLLRVR